MSEQLLTGYYIRLGTILDRALLVKFMQWTYEDLFPLQNFSHLAKTVDQYFSISTPVWWVEEQQEGSLPQSSSPVACIWVGNSVDQVHGDRHAHIFLLYVLPEHRRQGIGKALMQYVENWATKRGDRQIGLQVFMANTTALNLYNQLGYQTQSLWMFKSLRGD